MADAQVAGFPGGAAPPGAQSELLDVVRDIVVSECRERLLACGRHASEQIDALVLSALRQLPPHLRDMRAREAIQLVGGSLAAGGAGRQPGEAAAALGAEAAGAAASASVDSPLPSGTSWAHPQHPLVWLLPQYAGVRWACDRCADEFEGASFHCATCSFDLCESCWTGTLEVDYSKSPSDKKRQDGHAQSSSFSAKPKRLRPHTDGDGGSASSISASVKSMGIPVDSDALERMEELEHKTQDIDEFSQILRHAGRRVEMMPVEQRRNFMKRASDTYEKLLVAGKADRGGA